MNYARLGSLALQGEALIAFSRRGAWAAAALSAGCEHALCLERDEAASEQAAKNLALNGNAARAEFGLGDAMQRLDELAAEGKRYGFIMAEMPGRSAGSRLNFQAARHGAGLAARVYGMLAPGGVAAFSLAASELSAQGFANALQRGAVQAKLKAEIVAPQAWGPDYPQIEGFDAPGSRRFMALKCEARMDEN